MNTLQNQIETAKKEMPLGELMRRLGYDVQNHTFGVGQIDDPYYRVFLDGIDILFRRTDCVTGNGKDSSLVQNGGDKIEGEHPISTQRVVFPECLSGLLRQGRNDLGSHEAGSNHDEQEKANRKSDHKKGLPLSARILKWDSEGATSEAYFRAREIADSAPQLIEALKLLLNGCIGEDGPMLLVLPADIRIARAAIAKAEGRA